MKTRNEIGQKGQVVITAAVLFLAGSLVAIGGITGPIFKEVRSANNLLQSKQAFAVSEGSLEDVTYRLMTGLPYVSTEVLEIRGSTATTTITDVSEGKRITALGDKLNSIRKSEIDLKNGTGVAFFYGIQTGIGGVELENNSSIIGNVYSMGEVEGAGSNLIAGDVVSAGVAGEIDGVHATGSAYAHTIRNSQIDRDAYFQSILNTTVGGSQFPNSADQTEIELPISDEQIAGWEVNAAAGGTTSSPCPYIINSSQTIGPVKISCDVTISGNSTVVTLLGEVWVEGNITIKNNVIIRVDASLGEKSVVIIADNPSNRTTSSKIVLENNAIFEGSGTEGSYVMLISQNENAENGGDETGILVKNNAEGALFVYAKHGEISLENNASLKEVAAHTVNLKNNAVVTYETGATSLLFSSGPGGGYTITSWKEI
jgi:hypothetical protein